jgi:hypothetical protein
MVKMITHLDAKNVKLVMETKLQPNQTIIFFY